MKSLRDLALAIIAGLMVLSGLWMALFAVGWAEWLPGLLPLLSAVCLGILLVMVWTQRRWVRVESHNPDVERTSRLRDETSKNSAPSEPAVMELAALRYELFDADEPALFADFLEQPLLINTSASPTTGYETPGQVIENAILAYVKQLEAASHGRVTSNVNITHGSLTISLAFLSVYGFLAQYHDFVESLRLLRQQMQGLMRQVNSWYHLDSGREMRVRSNMQLNSPADVRARGETKEAEGILSDHPPFGVTTTIAPAHNDIRVHVANGTFVNWLLTLFLGVAISFQVLVVFVYLICVGSRGATICADFTEQFMQWSAYFMRQMHAFFN